MTTSELLEYIKKQLQAGVTKEKIRGDLLSNGWSNSDIDEGFGHFVGNGQTIIVPPSISNPVSTHTVSTGFVNSEKKPYVAPVDSLMDKSRVNLSPVSQIRDLQNLVVQATSPNQKAEKPKSRAKFIISIVLILLLILVVAGIGVAYKFYGNEIPNLLNMFNKQETLDEAAIIDSNEEEEDLKDAVSGVGEDLWVVYDEASRALRDKDLEAFKAVSYLEPSLEEEQFFEQMAEVLSLNMIVDKTQFVNIWQDEKQAIYSTNPFSIQSESTYGYSQKKISFVKDGEMWKLLMINDEVKEVSKSGTDKDSDLIEQEILKDLEDLDQDGLADKAELCIEGNSFPSCVKTDPTLRDTDGDGWWDSIDEDISKSE